MQLFVPTSSFQEESRSEDTVLWALLELIFLLHLEVEDDVVDGDGVFTGIVLRCASQESLCRNREEVMSKGEYWCDRKRDYGLPE